MIKKSFSLATSIIALAFTIIPESFFDNFLLFPSFTKEINIIINRSVTCVAIFALSLLLVGLYLACRWKIKIKGHNYIISVEYGNILKKKKCKKVISFDECFTTNVGDRPYEIKANSLCGQYLRMNPIENIDALIKSAGLKPIGKKTEFKNKNCYQSGRIVPNGKDLLLAFAKLDNEGLGVFSSKDEFLQSLKVFWQEIEKYYGQEDVCIPVLGSGKIRFESGESFNQQELLDMIISSYKLNSYKIKNPYRLRIICRRRNDFSLGKIGESI